MTTITLEVPDELVAQLRMDPTLLPALLQEAIHTKRAKGPLPATSAVSGPPLYQEIMDFLTSSSLSERTGYGTLQSFETRP